MDDSDYLPGKIFAYTIQFLIILSLITFSIETIPDLSSKSITILYITECVVVAIFTMEYVFRIIIEEKKMSFIFSFYGLIDLLAILPFYIVSGFDLRSVRIFRLLRLLRILKLFKYNQAVNRLYRAFLITREELVLFGFVALMLIYLAAVGIYYCENAAQPEEFKSIFHCLWWSLITLTTVGYGDMYPITIGGKIFTFFMLTVGLMVIAIPTGLIASALSKARDEIDGNK
ncbi:MAG: voltage-gated potassium channel [Planctomycetota bacterium]|nr:MAG: voltage-gated potassium channel [Planctomycetota bacterium]